MNQLVPAWTGFQIAKMTFTLIALAVLCCAQTTTTPGARRVTPITVTVSPATTAIQAGQTIQFTALVSGTGTQTVTWSVSPTVGTISATGLYTSPSTVSGPVTVTVSARSTLDTTKAGNATVAVNPAGGVTITPGSATIQAGRTQQLSATVTGSSSQGVAWTMASGVGSISAGGLYTAPSEVNATSSVSVRATSTADGSKSALALITVNPVVGVTVAPATALLSAGGTVQLTAAVQGSTNTLVTWSLSPALGSISQNGLYSAPSTLAVATVVTATATSVADGTKKGSAVLTVNPPISVTVTPSVATVSNGGTVQLAATVAGSATNGVSWRLNPAVGTLSTSGSSAVYTAPGTLATPQSIEVTAVAMANSAFTAKSVISLVPSTSISLLPSVATLYPGRVQQFTATVQGSENTAVRWTLTPALGTITSAGLYTAPTTITASQQVTVTATSLADATKQSTAIVNLKPTPTAMLYCSFDNSGSPCSGLKPQILSIQTDTQGQFNTGLRLCKGTTNCSSASQIRFTEPAISLRRGTIAFWFKQNNNAATSGPTEIFDTYPSNPYIKAGFTASVVRPVSAIQPGGSTRLTVTNHGLVNGDTIRLQGGTGDWVSSNQEWIVTVVDPNTLQIAYDSSTKSAPSMQAVSLLTAGNIKITYSADIKSDAYEHVVVKTRPLFLPAGTWVHIAWTWSGSRHRIYQNGSLDGTFDALSPFPYTAVQPSLRLGISNGGTQDVSIDDLVSYDYAFSDQEALAAARSSVPGPQEVLSPHGLTVTAQWGPGERKVHLTVDAGNDNAKDATAVEIEVNRDGVLQSRMSFDRLRDGFAEGLLDIPQFQSGTYTVEARALQSQGVVIANAQAEPYPFTKPEWLGNTFGTDENVPAQYWDPITLSGATGKTVNVVHRSYVMDSGYGLPTQMSSLGRNLLATPVALEIERSGSILPMNNKDVIVSPVTPHTATWQGRANAGGQVDVTVNGRVEYDGMMLLSLTLKPTAGSVTLDAVRIRTRMTSEFAKYVFAIKDQPFWWYTWSVSVPQASGEFNNNLTQSPRRFRTDNIFSTVFSDDDRGLQIFHNNMAGWQVNESKPWQRFIRETDGTVSYVNEIANSAFTLSEPMTVVIGYMATPVKRLPPSWRLATGGAYGGTRAPQSEFEYHFDFSLGYGWSTFGISSTTPADYKSGRANPIRVQNQVNGKRVLPFVNAHVLVPTAPVTWDELNVLKQETLNDGWSSSPSRGAGDYWAWSMSQLLNGPSTSDAIDGYYIDESYGYSANPSLLSGAGYIKPDGTHGIGLNLLGARDKFKRLGKVLIGSSKAPNLWFHTTGTMYPHMWSHGTMTFDGEIPTQDSYYIDADSDQTPDHFDVWNDNNSLLEPAKSGKGSWLLGISQSRKFGFIPVMWKGIECCGKPYEAKKQRQAQCLFQMHDILQQDQDLSWWQPKYNLGIHDPGVTFQGYWSNTQIVSADSQIKVSYYQGPRGILAYVANFGSADWTGSVSGGGIAGRTVTDAENNQPVVRDGSGAINLNVKRHDCRVIAVQ